MQTYVASTTLRDDYDRRVADGQAWVAEDGGEVVGIVVLEAEPDGLLVENVALYRRLGFVETGRIRGEDVKRVCMSERPASPPRA